MKIVVCGECYSPNLGDGVIALGIERLIKQVAPDAELRFFDLSGRSGFPEPSSLPNRTAKLSKFRQMQQRWLRKSYLLGSTANLLRYRRNWHNAGNSEVTTTFADADRIIIGGGQLLQDNRLAFPSVLSRLIEYAEHRRIPVTFFSVGVGTEWSRIGRWLLGKSLSMGIVDQIYCRDEASALGLRAEFPNITADVNVTTDAALAIDALKWRKQAPKYRLGFCIMHPSTIRWTSRDHPLADYLLATKFWVDMYVRLTQRGIDIRLFTNGAFDDQQFANHILERITAETNRNTNILLPRPTDPGQLIETIADFECLVANRLHANVIATTLQVNNVALGWDNKVEAFMSYTGQSQWFAPGDAPATTIASLIDDALRQTPRNVPLKSLHGRLACDMASALGVPRAATIAVDSPASEVQHGS